MMPGNGPLLMCPHCGWKFDIRLGGGLVPIHKWERGPNDCARCPGSEQAPRNPESDRRPLWKDLPGERKSAGVWPSESQEKEMLADAGILEKIGTENSPMADAALHIKALLSRVRDLEANVTKLADACYAAIGFLGGVSILTKEQLQQWLVDSIKAAGMVPLPRSCRAD